MIRIPEDTESGDNNPWRTSLEFASKLVTLLCFFNVSVILCVNKRTHAVCLMIWLRAVRQSGEASASFVNSGGTRAIVELLGAFEGFLGDTY
ncbi:hypothetical protein Bca4012_075882 [Brassica carinata]|uniref:Uncharacterized protein n=1 Tax=Brassica carinata TaxID=52824 RepID=A0A8X7U894_BRACI|nr:hypothetical protein Bca52824_073725 [Brassica carinata]